MRKKSNTKPLNKKNINKDIEKLKKDDFSEDKLTRGIQILNKYKEEVKSKREARIGKTLNEYVEEYEEKLNEKTIYEKIRPVVISFIIISIIVLIYVFFSFGPIIGISINKNIGITEDKKIDIITTEDDIYKSYNNELLIYSNGKISTYNSNAKKTWEYSISEQFKPEIYINGNYMAVTNNSKGIIYLFRNKQEILNKQVDGTIQNVYLDNLGNLAVEYSTSGYKKIITVIDKKGKLKYNTYLSTGAIVDIKLLKNASKLLVVQTNATSFNISTNIILIDGENLEGSAKEIAKLDDNYIYDLTIQGQNIIILLDNGIKKINMDTGAVNDINKFNSSQILFTSIFTNYYSIFEKNDTDIDGHYVIKNLRFDNSLISTAYTKNAPKIMKSEKNLSYYIYQDKVQVINKWGIEVKNINLTFQPKSIIIFSNQKVSALIYTNKVYIVSI